jgi:hypothetical protein
MDAPTVASRWAGISHPGVRFLERMMRAEVRGSERDAGRTVTYCLIPEELADEFHDMLREHAGLAEADPQGSGS